MYKFWSKAIWRSGDGKWASQVGVRKTALNRIGNLFYNNWKEKKSTSEEKCMKTKMFSNH